MPLTAGAAGQLAPVTAEPSPGGDVSAGGVVVPWAPGGAVDTVARRVAQKLSEQTGQRERQQVLDFHRCPLKGPKVRRNNAEVPPAAFFPAGEARRFRDWLAAQPPG